MGQSAFQAAAAAAAARARRDALHADADRGVRLSPV